MTNGILCFTSANTLDVNRVPETCPRVYLTEDEIEEKEREGYTVIFIVEETVTWKPPGSITRSYKPQRRGKRFQVVLTQS